MTLARGTTQPFQKTLEMGLERAGADLQEPGLKPNSDLGISNRQTQGWAC